jgi:hypothetical protein
LIFLDRWDRGRKLTAAEVRAAVERAIARSDKRSALSHVTGANGLAVAGARARAY